MTVLNPMWMKKTFFLIILSVEHVRGFSYEDDVDFDHENLIAKSRRAEKAIPANVKDIVSAFYYMRTIDFADAVAWCRNICSISSSMTPHM